MPFWHVQKLVGRVRGWKKAVIWSTICVSNIYAIDCFKVLFYTVFYTIFIDIFWIDLTHVYWLFITIMAKQIENSIMAELVASGHNEPNWKCHWLDIVLALVQMLYYGICKLFVTPMLKKIIGKMYNIDQKYIFVT